VHATTAEFAKRTGISVKTACGRVSPRLSVEAEMVLYRTLEEALKNVQNHADARNATVHLEQRGAGVELMVRDDGIGFDSNHPRARKKGNGGMGLIGVRERLASVGGALKIKSERGVGTEIQARIPLPRRAGRRLHDW
jgi:signal transduction histidine kinase